MKSKELKVHRFKKINKNQKKKNQKKKHKHLHRKSIRI